MTWPDHEAAHRVMRRLREAGMGREHPDDPDLNRLESGHVFGIGNWNGEWSVQAWHPGNPEGSFVLARLGRDESLVPQRAADQFRRPAMVKALGEQWQRAIAAGDPTGEKGLHYRAGWHSVSHNFNEFGGLE